MAPRNGFEQKVDSRYAQNIGIFVLKAGAGAAVLTPLLLAWPAIYNGTVQVSNAVTTVFEGIARLITMGN